MIIDGKRVADSILANLQTRVDKLKQRGVAPTLLVILVGDNPASVSFIKQKQKTAENIGAVVVLKQLPSTTSSEELASIIRKANADPTIHGIIIQRPLPTASPIDQSVLASVSPQKDVDGFVPNSPFDVPVAKAVAHLLTPYDLSRHRIAVIGRGETAGKPIAALFTKKGCTVETIHSQTQHREVLLKNATIIISCVGKERVVTANMLTKGVILISVGLWRDNAGKLHGDYEPGEIESIAAAYTPTPGGVGPVNVASLMENLVTASESYSK